MIDVEIKYKTPNYCPACNSIVETGVIFTYTYDVSYTDELQNEGTEIILSKCLNCDRPVLTEEQFRNIEEHSWINSKAQLYPVTDNIALKNAPGIVINPYKEAAKCYRAQAYDACVIMCRKGIEAICNDKGELKGNLADKLKNLKNKNVLETTLHSWANELRLIGNDGAHSHDQIVTQQDAKDSIDFFDALITYLYHLVSQYDKLKARRVK
ncbi:DUF4145 domain-containing protein [Pedobacter sp. PLR]|uniref:DUF4145 domain-containing protein n=1 Tax=Pedobacter sp. PLR TaxID=2994465 RepID=UPI0022484098|nr:DUF4145 domain-containing protein [Pedobacter sp. PLR]MCX2450063.1 DUF4145 domain-containing protein [Pedobacter sp. PLR]